MVCNLANYLSDFGHAVKILTMGDAPAAEPLIEGVEHVTLVSNEERSNFLLDNVKRIFRLCRYMKNEQVDAYVVMLPRTTQLMLGLSFLTKAPIIVSERADPTVYSSKTQKNLRKLASKASGWVFQTNEARDWYLPHLRGTSQKVIPNAINPVFLRAPYTADRERVIVGTGRLNEQKNFALLISAFALIANKFPEYKLVIYGKGSLLESLQSLAHEKGIADRVEFPGFVSDMPQRLEKASLFVLSSDYEGMPNALMEAMALGLPCVSTDCGGGGARFLIQNGENGILVPQRDELKMAEAIQKILTDKELAEKLGNDARKIQQTLAPERIYREWEQFILEQIEHCQK